MIKTNSGTHVAQEPHDKEHCNINAPEHSHPEVDCGHSVDAGPGVDLVDFNGPGNDKTIHKSDAEHGPGANK